MKQTPEEEAGDKRYWEHYERTGEFFMTSPIPMTRVACLMDVIDETEELYYIDDGTPMETSKKNPSASMPEEARVNLLQDGGQGSGSKESDPIELGSFEIENPEENLSRSPPPTFEEAEKHAEETTGGDDPLSSKGDDALLLENAGMFLHIALSLSEFVDSSC
jgi:hypothetical protein